MSTTEATSECVRRKRRLHSSLVLGTSVILAASLLDPRFPVEQLLQHVPTVASMSVIMLGARRGWWSTLSMICLMTFALLHIVGARYAYSNVPYDDAVKAVTGFSVNDACGFQRNHYDRLVHFLFGVLLPLPVAEILVRQSRLSSFGSVFLSVSFLAGVSGLYEISEWIAAIIMSPELAESYNGQQGDLWDAQKDMALALLGSLVVFVPVRRTLDRMATDHGREL